MDSLLSFNGRGPLQTMGGVEVLQPLYGAELVDLVALVLVVVLALVPAQGDFSKRVATWGLLLFIIFLILYY